MSKKLRVVHRWLGAAVLRLVVVQCFFGKSRQGKRPHELLTGQASRLGELHQTVCMLFCAMGNACLELHHRALDNRLCFQSTAEPLTLDVQTNSATVRAFDGHALRALLGEDGGQVAEDGIHLNHKFLLQLINLVDEF